MGKRISTIILCIFILCQFSLSTFANEVEVITDTYGVIQEHIYVVEDSLRASKISDIDVNLKNIESLDNSLRVDLSIANRDYQFTGSVIDNEYIPIVKSIGKYEIISMYIDDNVFELILKNNRDIIVVTDHTHGLVLNSSIIYNQDWYNDYIKAEVENIDYAPSIRSSYVTNYDKATSRNFSIFGDVWTETIVVNIHNDWPSDVYQPADFNTTLTIKSNKTTITKPYGHLLLEMALV